MRRASSRGIVILLNVLLVAFVLNLILQPLLEPDLGWHLRAGLDLVDHGWRLPDTIPILTPCRIGIGWNMPG